MGALYGFLAENGLFEQTLIVSNGASQFKIGQSANYWVHQERLFQKLWIGMSSRNADMSRQSVRFGTIIAH